MSDAFRNSILRSIRKLFAPPEGVVPTDAELLRRFVHLRDEAAFELLVWRHAALVVNVCRQVLGEDHGVEDAFQATFLVLVKKAGAILHKEALPGWLHQVAYRIALRARRRQGREQARRQPGETLEQVPAPAGSDLEPDVRQLLHEEISRLPARYRVPVVCCYLEARTHEEAARELGWSKGTVAGRLARARDLLRRRLLRRGVTLSVAALSASPAEAAGWTGRVGELIKGLGGLSSAGAGDRLSTGAVALAEGVIRDMFWSNLKWAAAVVVAVAMTGLGVALGPGRPRAPAETTSEERPADAGAEGAAKADDPLQEAINRAQARRALKQICLAMHNWHDTYNHFPPPAITDAKGKPLLSWRVAILPYIEQHNLFKQFRFNEPWDSPHNKKLLPLMPKIYAPVGVKTPRPHSTFYQLLVGPGAVWTRANVPYQPFGGGEGGPGLPGQPDVATGEGATAAPAAPGVSPVSMATFTDGTSNTILAIEAGTAVPWTKPEDVPYDAKKPIPRLGGQFPSIIHAAFADGSVRALPRRLDERTLRAAISPNGGEVIDWDKVEKIPVSPGATLRQDMLSRLRQRNEKLKEEAAPIREFLAELKEEIEGLRWAVESERLMALDPEAAALQKENAQLEKTLREWRDEARKLVAEVQRLRKELEKRKKR